MRIVEPGSCNMPLTDCRPFHLVVFALDFVKVHVYTPYRFLVTAYVSEKGLAWLVFGQKGKVLRRGSSEPFILSTAPKITALFFVAIAMQASLKLSSLCTTLYSNQQRIRSASMSSDHQLYLHEVHLDLYDNSRKAKDRQDSAFEASVWMNYNLVPDD